MNVVSDVRTVWRRRGDRFVGPDSEGWTVSITGILRGGEAHFLLPGEGCGQIVLSFVFRPQHGAALLFISLHPGSSVRIVHVYEGNIMDGGSSLKERLFFLLPGSSYRVQR